MVHKSAIIIRNADGKFGLQMRDGTLGIMNRLKWSTFGGACDEGESPMDGARRELEEELTVNSRIAEMKPLGVLEWSSTVTIHIFEYQKPLIWGEFKVQEGAGIGFFTKEEIFEIDSSELIQKILKLFYA